MSELIEARVPDLGSDSGVPVIELLVKVGDTVKNDQGLLTLESDKATMEVPSPVSGEIVELVAKLGDTLSAGDLVARIRVVASVGAIQESPGCFVPRSGRFVNRPKCFVQPQWAIHESPLQSCIY